MKLLLLFLFLITFFSDSFADSNAINKAQSEAVDKIFTDWDNTHSPGSGLGIFKEGEIIYSRGYGMANLEYDIPNNSQSVFRIGSTSKQFTAASIILLVEKEKLSLDDTLDKFFPDFPDYAKQITVAHLLHHTSGIRDYLTLSFLKGLQDDDFFTDKDVMSWLINQSELNFKPGEEFVYSNSGYWLLGQIVNQVAEMSMADFAMKEIFKPLGMTQTHFHNDHTQIVKNRASGYAPINETEFQISMTTLDMIGDGGIFTSIDDIKKWDDAYYKSNVLSRDFWRLMTQQGKLNNDEIIDYASGLFISDYKGLKTVSHGGAFVGFRAELLRFPEQKFSVAIFANRGDASPSTMANMVADVFLSDKYIMDKKPKANKEVPSKSNQEDIQYSYEQMVGMYELSPGMTIKFTILKEKLHAFQSWNNKEYHVVNESKNTYLIDGVDDIKFTFTELKENATEKVVVDQQGQVSELNRIQELDLSSINLDDFVGTFYSSELDVHYKIVLTDEILKLKINNNEPDEFVVVNENALNYQGTLLQFSRENNLITGFLLDAGRVKNLKFTKTQSSTK